MSPTSQGVRSQCWGLPDWEGIDFISFQHPHPQTVVVCFRSSEKKSIHPPSSARVETSSPTYKHRRQGLERFDRPSRVTQRCSKSQGREAVANVLFYWALQPPRTSSSYTPWLRPPLSRTAAALQVILPGQLHRTTWPDLDLDLDIEFCLLVAV